MSDPFLSEIRLFGFGWPPRGWAQCDGQILPINQNQSLYALLGTTFGGDGRTSFALPDLRGRVPGYQGDNIKIGEKGGVETVTLDATQLAAHSHTVKGTTANANTKAFTGHILAAGFDKRGSRQNPLNMYAPADNLVSLNSDSVTHNGSGQSHDNLQPCCVVNFCIALQGQFPSRN